MVNKLTILKLGGSVVTKKSKPLTFNPNAVRSLSKIIKKFNEPLIIVHGAGSFGHYYAKRYKISDKPTNSTKHVVKIRDSMQLLNQKIIKIFHENHVNTFSFSPTSMYHNRKIPNDWKKILQKSISLNLIPVTFGDVLIANNGFYIHSGDLIVHDLCKLLNPKRVIFASNIDGIYQNTEDVTSLIPIINNNKNNLKFSKLHYDVTGGIKTKINQSLKIANLGIDVQITNGLNTKNLSKALNGEHVGTLFVGDNV